MDGRKEGRNKVAFYTVQRRYKETAFMLVQISQAF